MSSTQRVRDSSGQDGPTRVDRSRAPVTAGRYRVGDAQLMDEVRSGNLDAFAELYDRYCHRAYGVALSVCGDEGRAQDAVQEGFLSIWKTSASYDSQQGAVAAWLLTVVRYRAIDLARRNGNHATRWASDDRLVERPALDDVSEKVIQQDNADQLRRSLDMLSGEQREVITLAYYGQLSHTEIATQLGLPSGTVKGRMRLGLLKLRASTGQAA
jgi:RNA polymerase sigma-70 factor, ECF subfamily